VVRATDYGSAQARVRTVVIGTHKDLPMISVPHGDVPRENWRTVRDAIGDLDPIVPPDVTFLPDSTVEVFGKRFPGAFKAFDLHVTRFYTDLSLQRFSSIPSGGNRLNLPDELKAPCWIGHDKGSLDVLGRLRWEKPSVTIRTEFYKPEKGRYLHPEEDRALTPLEAARLQGFSDDFVWCGSKYRVARQIGNAVPMELAKRIGEQVGSALLSG
jgi:DNA (cytosine-5)-methyltransferase 1